MREIRTRAKKSEMSTMRDSTLKVMQFVIVASVMVLFMPISTARGQCPSAWFAGPRVAGVGDEVRAVVVLPSGDVIVGGTFDTAGGVAARSIARFRPTTGNWSALGNGTNGIVYAIALLPGGDLIVGGSFTTAGSVAANRIARYNPTTGVWSAMGSGGTDGTVYALAVLPGGDVIASGVFTTAGGVSANNIARYNPTTGVASGLGSGLGGSFPEVYALQVISGGDVIVGGKFTTAGGVAANNIARYNPTTGVWSALGSGVTIAGGFTPRVSALAVLPGGSVIVGGTFDTAGGVAASSIVQYNPTTGAWSALGSGVTNIGSSPSVLTLAVLPGGDVILGGVFNQAGGITARNIARYNPTTGAWSALGSGITIGNSIVRVSALAVVPGGDVIVGGNFTQAGGVAASYIVRYNSTTSVWTTMGSGTNDFVSALAVLSDGAVVVGGNFISSGGVAANRVARYNSTTGAWSTLGSGTSGPVFTLAVLPGGDVIAGGSFTTAGGVTANYVARYNSTTGTWSALGNGTNGIVYAIAPLPGGDLIVGGSFTTAGSVAANRIARYNPSTGVWSALGSGITEPSASAEVYALEVLPSGDVIVGGDFTLAGGVAANNIARYNPITGAWSALGGGVTSSSSSFSIVYALAILPGGDVIVGGLFGTAGGVAANTVARYNPMTGVWSALGSGVTGPQNRLWVVGSLVVLPGGDVIVGGAFDTAGSVAANNIARYNPTAGTWSTLGSGTNAGVSALAVLPGGDVIFGGVFTQAGGNVSAYFARSTFGSPGPSIAAQPASRILCPTLNATLAATPAGEAPFTYQWQWRPVPAAPWFNIANGFNIDPLGASKRFTATGALTSSLNVSNASGLPGAILTSWENRCIVTDACGSVTSSTATITICRADFNCSGTVDVPDIFSFLAAWFANSPSADFDGNTLVEVPDIFAFLAAWFAGC